MYRRTVLLLLCLWSFQTLIFPSFARAEQVPVPAESEIQHLLGYIETSGCVFYRNGTWYQDTKAARNHLERKYAYFAGKGKVASAEDFITRCATKSEISGKRYLVRSNNGETLPLATWLLHELQRYRGKS